MIYLWEGITILLLCDMSFRKKVFLLQNNLSSKKINIFVAVCSLLERNHVFVTVCLWKGPMSSLQSVFDMEKYFRCSRI